MNLRRVSKANAKAEDGGWESPYQSSTYYAWFHRKKNLEIFVKHGRDLFVDKDRLAQRFEAARGDRVK